MPQEETTPQKIHFEYEGKKYEFPMEPDEQKLIMLPDGRILKPGCWLESYPPIPHELVDVTHLVAKATLTE